MNPFTRTVVPQWHVARDAYHHGLISGQGTTPQELNQVWANEIRGRYHSNFWDTLRVPQIRSQPTFTGATHCHHTHHHQHQHYHYEGPSPYVGNEGQLQTPHRVQQNEWRNPQLTLQNLQNPQPNLHQRPIPATRPAAQQTEPPAQPPPGHGDPPSAVGITPSPIPQTESTSVRQEEPSVEANPPPPPPFVTLHPNSQRAEHPSRDNNPDASVTVQQATPPPSNGQTVNENSGLLSPMNFHLFSTSTPRAFPSGLTPSLDASATLAYSGASSSQPLPTTPGANRESPASSLRIRPHVSFSSTLLGWSLESPPEDTLPEEPATNPGYGRIDTSYDFPEEFRDLPLFRQRYITVYPYADSQTVTVRDVILSVSEFFNREINTQEFLDSLDPQFVAAETAHILSILRKSQPMRRVSDLLPSTIRFKDLLRGKCRNAGFAVKVPGRKYCVLHMHLE